MTIPTARARQIVGALCALALVVFGAPWTAPSITHAQQQVLFFSATGIDGAPVTDLTAEELAVEYDGEESDIVSAELLEWPVKVTLMVDNGKGGRDSIDEIRAGLRAFVAALPDGVEVALVATSDEVLTVTDYTADKAALNAGIDEMERGNDDAYFLDALVAAASAVGADTGRDYFPVLVNLATDGDEGSEAGQAEFDQAVNHMGTSAATMHTRMLYTDDGDADSSRQAMVGATGGQVVQGSYETIADAAGLTASLEALAQDIGRKHALVSAQYRVTYNPPADAGPAPGISVGSTREALNLLPTIDGNIP